MPLAQVNIVLQIIANLAVVASVIFLAFQARLGIQMLKDAAERNHMDKHQSVSRMVSENPQLAELWARGSKAGIAKLTDAERVQFVNFYSYVLRIWEELYLQYRKGVIQPALWSANMRILRDTQPMPGAREVWEVRRHVFTAEFQTYYDDQAASGEARPLYEKTEISSI